LGGAILLIVIIALVVIGASAATPFVMKQELKEGDFFIYKGWETIGGVTAEAIYVVTVIEVDEDAGEMYIGYTMTGESGGTHEGSRSYEYIGNALLLDVAIGGLEIFIDKDDIVTSINGLSESYSVALSGLTPLITQKYSGNLYGFADVEFSVKMGTNLIVSADITDDSGSRGFRLIDTNVRWAKAL